MTIRGMQSSTWALTTDKLGSGAPILFKHLLRPNDNTRLIPGVDACRVGNYYQN
ncbi:Hypothetical protein FKW44_007416 [Caligus rogercresseyi]|uniref:Uncharacterized protein n=1 Tax=Caligus rogercresseyi TaxID=217165 RepID=A0A7T8KEP3_CALRO|nr:Hypothetical protein FKW44_007416 [Caligus rogercresseyi]